MRDTLTILPPKEWEQPSFDIPLPPGIYNINIDDSGAKIDITPISEHGVN